MKNEKYKHSRKNINYEDIYSNDEALVRSERRSKKRKKVSIWKIISVTFFAILGIAGAGLLYLYKTLSSFNFEDITADEIVEIDRKRDLEDLVDDTKVLNVLLIGSDSMSAGDGGRSDALKILSLNLRTKKIKIVSLMRDLWVEIPGYGKDRINSAYALGKGPLTLKTVEKNFGVLIDRYVIVDFLQFSNVINAIGGIDIELDRQEAIYINVHSSQKNSKLIPPPRGEKKIFHLNGDQALQQARNRDSRGSDYDRVDRQEIIIQIVIETIKERVKNGNIAQIADLASKIGPMVTTNLKPAEITRLVGGASTYLAYDIERLRLPTNDNAKDAKIDGKWVLTIPDKLKSKKDLCSFIYDTGREKQEKEN